MRATPFLFASFIAAASTTSGSEVVLFANLLKRQEPGTPLYNCHDNCGTAITISKEGSPCHSSAFKTDYENCLICSGPDNFDIWRYYGSGLSAAGKTCGLETEPKDGKQPDSGLAVHPGSSSSSTGAGSTPALSPRTTASTAGSVTTSISMLTSSDVVSTPILSSAGSGASSQSANGTGRFTAAHPETTMNAAASFGVADAAGVLGAMVVGAVLAM